MTLHVVLGPPAAGKTTWVLTRAKANDLVIDYDRIATSLTHGDASSHDHPRHLANVAWRARQAAISEALKHADAEAFDIYIIHSQPKREAMIKYMSAGAQVHTIDPGKDVVLARCATQRPAKALVIAERWYAAQHRGELANPVPSRAW